MITLIDGDLYQWDTGRVVLVEPDSGYTIHEVHFTTKKMEFAYVVNTYDEDGAIYCKIPNILLQQYQAIICYEVRENEEGEESVSTTTFSVIKRNRPVDYVYTELEKYTYKEINNRVATLETDVGELKESVNEAGVLANEAYVIAEEAQSTANGFSEKLESLDASVVKTINNILPDENGNIALETGTGSPGEVDSVVEF